LNIINRLKNTGMFQAYPTFFKMLYGWDVSLKNKIDKHNK